MRRVQWLAVAVSVGCVGASAYAQSVIGSRSYAGHAELAVVRAAPLGLQRQTLTVEAATTPYTATFTMAAPGGAAASVTYGLLELGSNPIALGLLVRTAESGAEILPRSMVAAAQAGPAGTSLLAYGSLAGTDAAGPFRGLLILQLQQTAAPPPTDPTDPTDPPPVTYPGLPSFDGTTLRVPAAWQVQKFEGFALRLASKYGTLPGGTTATVPPSWREGVMQCHGAQGFVYEIPLMVTYQGHVNGAILYTRDGTFPSWEPQERWHAIAYGPGHTKYVFR